MGAISIGKLRAILIDKRKRSRSESRRKLVGDFAKVGSLFSLQGAIPFFLCKAVVRSPFLDWQGGPFFSFARRSVRSLFLLQGDRKKSKEFGAKVRANPRCATLPYYLILTADSSLTNIMSTNIMSTNNMSTNNMSTSA